MAVPIEVTRKVLEEIGSLLRGGGRKLLIEISTLKSELREVLSALPENLDVCSIHPLFGPGVQDLEGRRVILVDVPGKKGCERIISILSDLGLKVERSNPDEHDSFISFTILLPYLLGVSFLRLTEKLGPKLKVFSGTSHEYFKVLSLAVLADEPSFVENLLSREGTRDAWLRFKGEVSEVLSMAEEGTLSKYLREVRIKRRGEIDQAYKRFYRAL